LCLSHCPRVVFAEGVVFHGRQNLAIRAAAVSRRIFARRLKTGGLGEVPGGAVLMTIHRVVEVFERRLPLVLALCTPGLVEAERDAANGAEYQQLLQKGQRVRPHILT